MESLAKRGVLKRLTVIIHWWRLPQSPPDQWCQFRDCRSFWISAGLLPAASGRAGSAEKKGRKSVFTQTVNHQGNRRGRGSQPAMCLPSPTSCSEEEKSPGSYFSPAQACRAGVSMEKQGLRQASPWTFTEKEKRATRTEIEGNMKLTDIFPPTLTNKSSAQKQCGDGRVISRQ